MTKKLPVSDFRAVRSKLEPHEFAISEGQDVPPSDLIKETVWNGIMHLPEDVSIRITDHNGQKLRLLYDLWSDWIEAIGDPDAPDELFYCMLDAADCFQCATFNFLHGFYRAALAEIRGALELVIIGTHANINPSDPDFQAWKLGNSTEWGFTRARRRLSGVARADQAKWMFENGSFMASTYQCLCNFTHSRPDSNDGALWESNGPVYNNKAIQLVFTSAASVYAICYLLVRVARPTFQLKKDSAALFDMRGLPYQAECLRAFKELYG